MKSLSAAFVVLAGLLAWAFAPVFAPQNVVFSNDGPLGQISGPRSAMPAATHALWDDGNWLGGAALPVAFSPSGGLRMACFVPETILVAGLLWVCAAAGWWWWSGHGVKRSLREVTGATAGLLALVALVAIPLMEHAGWAAMFCALLPVIFMGLLMLTLTTDEHG